MSVASPDLTGRGYDYSSEVFLSDKAHRASGGDGVPVYVEPSEPRSNAVWRKIIR